MLTLGLQEARGRGADMKMLKALTAFVQHIPGGFPGLSTTFCGAFSAPFQDPERHVEVLLFLITNVNVSQMSVISNS